MINTQPSSPYIVTANKSTYNITIDNESGHNYASNTPMQIRRLAMALIQACDWMELQDNKVAVFHP